MRAAGQNPANIQHQTRPRQDQLKGTQTQGGLRERGKGSGRRGNAAIATGGGVSHTELAALLVKGEKQLNGCSKPAATAKTAIGVMIETPQMHKEGGSAPMFYKEQRPWG